MKIVTSFFKEVNIIEWCFLALRTWILPLEKYNEQIPESGLIVEVGCGHGIVVQYLARRSTDRIIVGYDTDPRRLKIAKKSAKLCTNIKFRQNLFIEGSQKSASAVTVIGVFCLLDDDNTIQILKAAKSCLSNNGVLHINDIPKKKTIIHKLHIMRESMLGLVGFTQGQGVFLRTDDEWRQILNIAGFNQVEEFKASVFMHSTFDWICK